MNSLCLHITNGDPELRLVPIHIFTVVAYTSLPGEGATRVINAMSYLQNVSQEEFRFDGFIRTLSRDCQALIVTDEKNIGARSRLSALILDGMLFINAILDNLDDHEVRIHIRNQLFRRPLRGAVKELRDNKCLLDETLTHQFELFDGLLQVDSDWLMEQYTSALPSKNLSSARDLFEILMESVKGTDGTQAITQLLQHILCVRADASVRTRYIRFLDVTLESLLFKGKGLDPDFCASPVPYLTFSQLEQLLNTAEVDRLKHDNLRMQFQMTNLEEEKKMIIERQVKHIAELEHEMTRINSELTLSKGQLKKDSMAIRDELETIIASLKKELDDERERSKVLENQLHFLKCNYDEVKSPKLADIDTDNATGKLQDKICVAPVTIPLPPPLPPPKTAPPPPPPPVPVGSKLAPPSPSDGIMPADSGTLQLYPTPSSKLKAMQWKKILPKDIPGTLWEMIDMTIFDGRVDFKLVDRLFERQPGTFTDGIAERMKGSIIDRIITRDSKTHIAIPLKRDNLQNDERCLANALERMDEQIFTQQLCAPFRKSFWRKDEGPNGDEIPLIDDEVVRANAGLISIIIL